MPADHGHDGSRRDKDRDQDREGDHDKDLDADVAEARVRQRDDDLAADEALADAYAAREPDSDVGVPLPLLSVPEMLRTARHFADLSQRELASRSGVPKSVLGDLESGRTQAPAFGLVERLLAACGLRLVLMDPRLATPVFRRAHDGALDAGGRHFPGHLDVRVVADDSQWWFSRLIPGQRQRPAFTADWRRNQNRPRVRRPRAQRRAGEQQGRQAGAQPAAGRSGRVGNTPGSPEVSGAAPLDG